MEYVFSDGIYTLTKNESEIIKIGGINESIIAPKGFSWNGVTSYRTTGKTLKPSMIHDWLIFDERINRIKIKKELMYNLRSSCRAQSSEQKA